MKANVLISWVPALLLALIAPSLVFGHGDEDHGKDYHIEVVHVMKTGFHGRIDGKVVEVVLAPDADIEKEGKDLDIGDLKVGDLVFVKGAKMPGNKIGGSKVTIDMSSKHSEYEHKEHLK